MVCREKAKAKHTKQLQNWQFALEVGRTRCRECTNTQVTVHRHHTACSATQFDTVRHSSTQYDTVQHSSIQFDTIRHSSTQFATVRHNTTQFNTVRYSTTQFDTVRYRELMCCRRREIPLKDVTGPTMQPQTKTQRRQRKRQQRHNEKLRRSKIYLTSL